MTLAFFFLKAGRLNVCIILFLVALLCVTFSSSHSLFDREELVSDITKTVLLTADIGTKLNGRVDT